MAKSKQNRLTQGRRDAATQNVLMSHYVLSILRSQKPEELKPFSPNFTWWGAQSTTQTLVDD